MKPHDSTILLRDFFNDPNNRRKYEPFSERFGPRIKQWFVDMGLAESDAEEFKSELLLRVFDGFTKGEEPAEKSLFFQSARKFISLDEEGEKLTGEKEFLDLLHEFIRNDANLRSTIILKGVLANPKNREWFDKFAMKFQPRMKQLCMNVGLQDTDAEDVTSRILLRLVEREIFRDFLFKGMPRFRSWMKVMVRKAVLTFLRNRNRVLGGKSVGDPNVQDALQTVDEPLTQSLVDDLGMTYEKVDQRIQEACATVQKKVQPKTWEAFCLCVKEGFAGNEAAEKLEISEASVFAAVSRVKSMLRQQRPSLFPDDDHLVT
jgi:RNA polymerase sigma factor (sigma-70 family)